MGQEQETSLRNENNSVKERRAQREGERKKDSAKRKVEKVSKDCVCRSKYHIERRNKRIK
jgi:hypothetical protein